MRIVVGYTASGGKIFRDLGISHAVAPAVNGNNQTRLDSLGTVIDAASRIRFDVYGGLSRIPEYYYFGKSKRLVPC